jgi:hypothetical protein
MTSEDWEDLANPSDLWSVYISDIAVSLVVTSWVK